MNLNLSENKINEIIDSSINKILQEYHVDQRLPFDDDFYGKKNQLEQYKDWLEDFGKYGELPPSSLNFKEELIRTIENLKKSKRFYNYCTNENYRYIYRYLNDKIVKRICSNIEIDDKGNVYIERTLRMVYKPEDTTSGLYDDLKHKYQNNLGGCWSYKRDGSDSYYGEGRFFLKLIGRIRVDDIDFVNTVYTTCMNGDECEIRVKPNAIVALEEIEYRGYNHVFNPTLLSKATYFGSNNGYKGDFAQVKDTYKQKISYMDRENNVFDENGVSNKLESLIENGKKPRDVFDEFQEISFGIAKVMVRSIGYNYYDITKNKIICKKWFKSRNDIDKLWNKIIHLYLKINTR